MPIIARAVRKGGFSIHQSKQIGIKNIYLNGYLGKSFFIKATAMIFPLGFNVRADWLVANGTYSLDHNKQSSEGKRTCWFSWRFPRFKVIIP